jgi:hypothetical protein
MTKGMSRAARLPDKMSFSRKRIYTRRIPGALWRIRDVQIGRCPHARMSGREVQFHLATNAGRIKMPRKSQVVTLATQRGTNE